MDFFFWCFVVAMLTETVLYAAAPRVYALAARIPFGARRRLVLHPRALEALRAPGREGATGYRQSAVGAVDLGRLELPERLDIDGLVLHFHLSHGIAIARLPYSWVKRAAYGLVRVDVVATDNALELRPRFVFLSWPSIVALTPIGVVGVVTMTRPSEWPGHFVMGALFVGINVVIGLIVGRSRLEAGVVEIERQIQAALVHAETAA